MDRAHVRGVGSLLEVKQRYSNKYELLVYFIKDANLLEEALEQGLFI